MPKPSVSQPKSSKSSRNRDQEIVCGGFNGYRAVAKSTLYRWYGFALSSIEREDLQQIAAYAAVEALNILGQDAPLKLVAKETRKVLYQQIKAEGWYLEHFKRPDGKYSSRWIRADQAIADRILVLANSLQPSSQPFTSFEQEIAA